LEFVNLIPYFVLHEETRGKKKGAERGWSGVVVGVREQEIALLFFFLRSD
jgi:hypothetical protein